MQTIKTSEVLLSCSCLNYHQCKRQNMRHIKPHLQKIRLYNFESWLMTKCVIIFHDQSLCCLKLLVFRDCQVNTGNTAGKVKEDWWERGLIHSFSQQQCLVWTKYCLRHWDYRQKCLPLWSLYFSAGKQTLKVWCVPCFHVKCMLWKWHGEKCNERLLGERDRWLQFIKGDQGSPVVFEQTSKRTEWMIHVDTWRKKYLQ